MDRQHPGGSFAAGEAAHQRNHPTFVIVSIRVEVERPSLTCMAEQNPQHFEPGVKADVLRRFRSAAVQIENAAGNSGLIQLPLGFRHMYGNSAVWGRVGTDEQQLHAATSETR